MRLGWVMPYTLIWRYMLLHLTSLMVTLIPSKINNHLLKH